MPTPRISSATTDTLISGTSLSLDRPSDVADGDTVWLLVGFATGDPGALTPPSGFTEVGFFPGVYSNVYAAVKPVVDAGSEPASYQLGWVNNMRAAGVCVAVEGSDPSDPVDVAANTETSPSSTTLRLNGVTTTGDDEMLFLVYTIEADGPTITGPGVSIATAGVGGAGPDVRVKAEFQAQLLAGPTGEKPATLSGSSRGNSLILAVRPGAPVVIPPDNRMGGTGAIRKPPRR